MWYKRSSPKSILMRTCTVFDQYQEFHPINFH